MAKTMQPQKMRFSQAIQTPMYKNLVNNTLGDPARGARFIANITSAVAVNPALQECNPGTILAGALLGESLLLQPSPQLGQFYLVPFKSKAKRDRQGNVIEPASVKAQFVLGYRGTLRAAIDRCIQGTLSGDNNRLLMCGNPTQNTGTFHDSHTVDAQSYYCMKVSSRDSPRTNKQNIADLERKFGKNSNVVRVRVDGEFPENEDDVFIPMALATKAVNTEPLEHCSPARISIGCDVARFGNDDTAIAQNIDGDIQKLVTRHGQDLYATADDIIAIYKTLRAAYPQYRGLIYAVIDDTGVGGGVTDILNREKIRQKLTKLMVVPVNFSSAVPDKEAAGRYADIATWMWAVLRDMATAGTLHIPNDSTLIGQLTTRKYIFSGAPAKLKLESKDALKKRGLTSPDRADAVALALYEGGIFDVRSLI